jgi:glycosyltransferase involved in cell wall biosynthesis
MRVLYIITQGEQGGGQKNVLDLANGMAARGHEVFIATGKIENEGDRWLCSEFQKSPQPLLKGGVQCHEIQSLQREISLVKDIKSVFEILKLFKKVKPDIVHLHSSKAGMAGSLAGFLYKLTPPLFSIEKSPFKKGRQKTKVIYTVHGFVFLEPMSTIKKLIYISFEYISSLFRDFTVMISEKDIEAGKKYHILRNSPLVKGEWPKGRGGFALIYNGLDESLEKQMLSREEARKYFLEKIPPLPFGKMNAPIVGTIANWYKTKGLEYFIDAAKEVVKEKSSTIFVVMGFGEESYKKELEERIKKNGLENNFFLLGKTPGAFKYLKGLDVFALTSVKEGLPYCLLEAKLANVSIVATNVGGIPEMAKNFKINLAESKNSEDIGEKIKYTLREGVKEGCEFPKVYSLENMITQTEEVYKNL